MKSAYELIMERLAKEDVAKGIKPLTEDQKKHIAEIESLYKSRVAEREVFLEGKIAAARASGNLSEAEEIQKELVRERKRLQQDCEDKKEQVRSGSK